MIPAAKSLITTETEGGGNRPLEALQLALTKVDKKFVRRPGRPECMKQDRRARHHNHIHINNERMMAAGGGQHTDRWHIKN